jgi:hypothetical protein
MVEQSYDPIVLAEPWWTYTGTKPETVDTAKENLQFTGTPLLGNQALGKLIVGNTEKT